ncbi:MAG: response regulator [Flavisolibacter sp.]
MPNRSVLICDNDYSFLNEMEKGLAGGNFDVDTLDNAIDLIPSALRLRPQVVIVNPDLQGFNEFDVCKQLIEGQHIEVILLLDKHSAARARIGDCEAEDILTKPVKIKDLIHLLEKLMAVDQ